VNKKVWILDDKELTHDSEFDIYKKHGIEWRWTTTTDYHHDLQEFGKDADVVVTQVGYPMDDPLIKQLEACKAILTFGMGFNNVNLALARQLDIDVCHVPDYCLDEVADHTLALMLASIRKLHQHDRSVKEGKWNPVLTQPVRRLKNTVIGLYGFGRIARKVAKRLRPFGSTIMAYDAYVPEDVFEEYHVEKVDFATLLRSSNVLSLHVPLTPETKGSLDYVHLRTLPQDATVINTCRGGVINEQDLLQLMKEGHISGVGLDVLEIEPPREDNILISDERTIISPHAAYFSVEAEEELQIRTAENALRVMNGEQPYHIVNDTSFE